MGFLRLAARENVPTRRARLALGCFALVRTVGSTISGAAEVTSCGFRQTNSKVTTAASQR